MVMVRVMVMVMVEITMWYLGSLATSCDGNQGIPWEEESQPGRRSDTSPQAATWSQVGWGKSFFGASSSPTYHKLERRCQRRGGGWSSSLAGRRSPVHKHRGQIISLSWQADILDIQGVQSACRDQFKFMSPGDYPPSRGHPQQLPWKQNKSEKSNIPPSLLFLLITIIMIILILIMMVGLKQELGGSSGHGGQLDRVPGAILGEATTSLSHSTHPQIQIRTQIQIHTQIQTTYMWNS